MLWSYREVPNATTGLSPYQLVYGRVGRGPLSVLQDTWGAKDLEPERSKKEGDLKYFKLLEEDLKMAAEVAEKHAVVAKEVYVKNYNKNTKEKQFKVGDLVLVLIPDSSNKLLARWQGPGVVSDVLSDHA